MRDDFNARTERIFDAVFLKKPDRVPVVLEYSAFAAVVTGVSMAKFVSSPRKATETMIQAYHLVGGGDAVNYGSFWPWGLSYDFLCQVKVPGYDLPEDEIWQAVEAELLRQSDYEAILTEGWPAVLRNIMEERILAQAPRPLVAARLEDFNSRRAWQELGLPVLSGGDVTTPYELLCGGRSLMAFVQDLFGLPDKVEEVMAAMVPHLAQVTIAANRGKGYPMLWVGGWRAAPAGLSPQMFERFVWPYFRRLVEEVVEAGFIALLHLDSNWDRELARFKELPRGKCLMALDGETDISKAREILDGHMCVMGDVPASLLYSGDPDEVYTYARRLIEQLGPDGFILQSGCDIPANAKLENVQAMVAAAMD